MNEVKPMGMGMAICSACGKEKAARALGICPACLRSRVPGEAQLAVHRESRQKLGLPKDPPRDPDGAGCRLCANECRPGPEALGYCGLRKNAAGKIVSLAGREKALAHIYFDRLPTNCCAAWFCRGSREKGYNLAVFFYGCNFDCLFCQNHSHKWLAEAPLITEDELVAAALRPEVRCVCFFGGSPEPQLPFALRVSRRIAESSRDKKHICWEWNGCGHPALVSKAAELSAQSGGTVKFDLKAFHPSMALALCGVENRRAYENFSRLSKLFPTKDLLTASTLLVPGYLDDKEVGAIARFIADQDPDIPYSLLVFHPDYLMTDLPATPRQQVESCTTAARRYLSRVNVGNLHLL